MSQPRRRCNQKVSLIPPNVGFAPVGDVYLLVRGFPEVPIAGVRGKLIPSLGLVGVITRRQNCAVVNGNTGVVADGKDGKFRLRLRLRLIKHVYVLRDSLSLVVEFHHRRLNSDGVGLVEATTVGYQIIEELQGRHGRVECVGYLEIPVPHLTHHFHDELHTPLVGGVVQHAIGLISCVVGFRFADFGGL